MEVMRNIFLMRRWQWIVSLYNSNAKQNTGAQPACMLLTFTLETSKLSNMRLDMVYTKATGIISLLNMVNKSYLTKLYLTSL